jgi:hypothetical protein
MRPLSLSGMRFITAGFLGCGRSGAEIPVGFSRCPSAWCLHEKLFEFKIESLFDCSSSHHQFVEGLLSESLSDFVVRLNGINLNMYRRLVANYFSISCGEFNIRLKALDE